MRKATRSKLLNKSLRIGALFLFALSSLSACNFSYTQVEYEKAKRAAAKEDYPAALQHYTRIISKDFDSELALDAARRAARLSFLESKDYQKAIQFYRHLILYSSDSEERIDAQRKIALIFFEKLSDFHKAIEEYSKLLTLDKSPEEKYLYQMNIAKSYFQLDKFYQAEVELDSMLSRFEDPHKQFDLLSFKGNLFLTTKQYDKAIPIFEKLLQTHPEKSREENVALSLAAVYEDQQKFSEAIDLLKELKLSERSPEFIELKIKRLEERAKNLPGAQGFKK